MISIKKAKVEDFSSISELDLSIAKYGYDTIRLADSAQAWRTWIEHDLAFIAKGQDDVLIGAIIAFPVKNRRWCIHKILVAHEYLQDNVALQLLETLLEVIDNREEKAYIVVPPQDLYAIKLYSLLGFSKKTLHQNYLGDNEDRLIMSRPTKWSDAKKPKHKEITRKAGRIWSTLDIASDISTPYVKNACTLTN